MARHPADCLSARAAKSKRAFLLAVQIINIPHRIDAQKGRLETEGAEPERNMAKAAFTVPASIVGTFFAIYRKQ